MTTIDDVTDVTEVDEEDQPPPDMRRWYAVVAIMAIAVVTLGVAVVLLANRKTDDQTIPVPNSVDVGFAQDMMTHHLQAVQMAGIVRDRTDDPEIKQIAFDIETNQQNQVGQMTGWLGIWGLSVNNPDKPMGWMGSMAAEHPLQGDGLMPGMATTDQVNQLKTLPPAQMDVLFLQLMIRHHQGGLPMLDYAAQHGSLQTVRTFARRDAAAQTLEITNMTKMLTARGAQPLAPPS
ncbi:MAG: DUF305 domain-containing protein [Mycobacteriales bacterium]